MVAVPDSRPLRKYQPIWNRIKNRETCLLAVEAYMVPRVRKAIKKEKNIDLGFKLLNSDDNFRLTFSYDKGKKLLTVKLKHHNLKGIEL